MQNNDEHDVTQDCDSEIELTDQEIKAIASLKRLAKKWPSSLLVFCSGTMTIRKGGS